MPSNRPGVQWLERFMQAQGKVAGNSLFMTFSIGQAGAVMGLAKAHPEEIEVARQMIEQMKGDVADLEQAMDELKGVVRDMIANAERNLAVLG